MGIDELENSWYAIVDVGSKDIVFREAIATGVLTLSSYEDSVQ
jgi:molybdenum cofactor biosynthesis enzyme